jgi:hypothetical protein
MAYRYEAKTIEGFVQQLAVSYVANGYFFFVTGVIPEGKNPRHVDEKLIAKYGIDVSKFTRARRKAAGQASIQYLRFERFFILAATHGIHEFFLPTDEGGEGARIKDCRKVPIKFASYAISFRGGHAHVRIERETFRDLHAFLVGHALRSREWLEAELRNLPFQPWAPVRGQLFQLVRAVNARRKVAGYDPIDKGCVRTKRRSVKPFGSEAQTEVLHSSQLLNTVPTSSRIGDGLDRAEEADRLFALKVS